MEKEIFGFSENRIKEDIDYKYKISKKIKYSFDYLLKKLPVNKLTKTLQNLKTHKGKNYDFFFIKDGDAIILVRQYQTHLTIYTENTVKKIPDFYEKEFSIFTMVDNDEKMTDEDWTEDDLRTFKQVLPDIFKLVKSNSVHTMWNDLCFKRPKYCDVKVVSHGNHVDDLNTLLFACDEISQRHLELFAENEMFEAVKKLKTGDTFGDYRIIHDTSTELKNDYYHGVGVWTTRTDEFGKKHETKPEWMDVYSLCNWYYKEMFPEIELKEKVIQFYKDKWREAYLPLTKMFFHNEIDFYNCMIDEFMRILNSMNTLLDNRPFKCTETEFREIVSKNCIDNLKYLYKNLVDERK